MKRRDFIIKGVLWGLAAGSLTSLPRISRAVEAVTGADKACDMVAIKGGEPDAMFDKAMEAFGGIKRFVKPNQTVVVKPNIGWDVPPERGGNTNPKLVRQIIKHCLDAGAKEVYVFDHPCDQWAKCYENSGIEQAVKEAGGKIIPAHKEGYYGDIEIKRGERLKSAKVHEKVLESDVFINVPILKSHGSAKVTVGMKNHMGIVWDRGYWHRNDLHQCIADFATFKRPDLTVIDAYYVMKKNGPRGVSVADVEVMKSQIIATDPVAADTAATRMFGLDPNEVGYIKSAQRLQVGTMDLSTLAINKINL
ncbi:conserved hypothetical protein [uncultured Desulfobacterium sp.]|uniref:DUF362 domain-containing protein n=1 Tax=uncultured Desulfobacterium sp. TaxID=201089 RepID=A0A445MTQ3_9BACT|nr:conserved hypothetical protein [uncultured Desulfobacterium sp.]